MSANEAEHTAEQSNEQNQQPPARETQSGEDVSAVNLENIMHIPLQISVELGRIQMPLHAAARLSRGTVVDMQKEAGSSVDICANGKVFARGEVVSADGKLGVRILEVTSTGDRIRTLG